MTREQHIALAVGLPAALVPLSLLLLVSRKRRKLPAMGSMTQQSATALMRFLSTVANDVGVGKDAYVVGGAVRNYLLGHGIKDLDLVLDSVRAGMDSTAFAKAIAARIPAQTNLTTNQYGVAILTVQDDFYLGGENLKGEQIEIANARKEWYGEQAGKGYKPHKVTRATIEEDVRRRELTFNTLMWQLAELAEGPDKAKIIDITGCGLPDLRAGEMRCPSDATRTLTEDPTRLLRLIKFSTKYNFKLTPATKAAARRSAAAIKNAPHEAIATLLLNVLLKDKKLARPALKQMKDLGLLEPIKEMYQDIPAFRNTLNHWAQDREVRLMFDLADLGFPTGPRMRSMTPREQQRFREVAYTMEPVKAKEYLTRLRQPTRAFEDRAFMPALMAAHGATGKHAPAFAKRVQCKTRALLLEDPLLAFDAPRLRARIQEVRF